MPERVLHRHSERRYRVVVLDSKDNVESSYGDFPSDNELVRRVLMFAKTKHGDRAVLQCQDFPVIPPWETIA